MASPAPFIIEEYVRWSDVDYAGIIFYGAYVRFFEIAETELFRACELPYRAMFDRFNIYLPRCRKSVVPEKPAAGQPAGGTETILVVDDETMITDVAEALLQKGTDPLRANAVRRSRTSCGQDEGCGEYRGEGSAHGRARRRSSRDHASAFARLFVPSPCA